MAALAHLYISAMRSHRALLPVGLAQFGCDFRLAGTPHLGSPQKMIYRSATRTELGVFDGKRRSKWITRGSPKAADTSQMETLLVVLRRSFEYDVSLY
jgi:hypothetical protein